MRSLRFLRLAPICFLIAFVLQTTWSIVTTSPTFDEPYHIVRSYVYLRTGDSALLKWGGHPPLANLVHVLPLLLRPDIRIPTHEAGWPQVRSFADVFQVADEFLWRLGNDPERIMGLARVSAVGLALALAGVLLLWTRQMNYTRRIATSQAQMLASPAAVALASLLFCFDPNIIAHSGLVTTDIGAALLIFLSSYCLWRFCVHPSWPRLLVVGITFGLAQATKFSALSLVLAFGVLLLMWVFEKDGPSEAFPVPGQGRFGQQRTIRSLYRVATLMVIISVVGFVALWAVYGFELQPLLPHESEHALLDRLLPVGSPASRRIVYHLAEAIRVPAPSYFSELAWLRQYAEKGHPSFIMGRYGVQGWWFYFPIAFMIKTPIPVLLLLAATALLCFRERRAESNERYLLVPMLFLSLSSVFSSIDIGYRNIIPLLPFAYTYVSRLAVRSTSGLARAGLLTLCLWHVLGTCAVAPHYLAYFNELVGGPRQGYRYLVDSNLDWGQDLKNLGSYLDRRGIEELYLDYFGTADPGYYGIQYLPMPSEAPANDAPAAYYAISATQLQGVYGRQDASLHWLHQYAPIDNVGFSIFIYRLP